MEDHDIMEARVDAAWEIANDMIVAVINGVDRHGKDPEIHIIIASAIGKLIDGLEEVNRKIPVAIIDYLKMSRGELF